jgi:hypothetical protein
VSQPSLASPGAAASEQKQRTNVYTVMLVISFICIVVSCVLLYMELKRWGNYPWWRTTDAEPRAAWLIDPLAPIPSVRGELV